MGNIMSNKSDFTDEVFGTPAHIATMKRSRQLWRLLKHDPKYSSYGRLVCVVGGAGAESVDIMDNLVRLTGAGSFQYFPAEQADALCADLDEIGLNAGRWEQCWGGSDAYAKSKQILADLTLPQDLTLVQLSGDSPASLVRATADLSMDCGVMPALGRTMRGLEAPGLCLVALDGSGTPVATASSYRGMHADCPYADHAFWGALATRPDRRGEKLAMILGASAIVHMWEQLGTRGFYTGIKADNAGSMAVCAKQGVVRSEWAFIACSDPARFGDTPLTK
jgi:acetyltransferase (GNAT) family protein